MRVLQGGKSSTRPTKPSGNTSSGEASSSDAKRPSEFLTIREAAAYLRVGRKQIDEAIRRRRLPVVQLTSSRRALRIYREDLLKLRAGVQ